MSPSPRQVELWCDSFHEGVWACEQVRQLRPEATCKVTYHLGFLPVYQFDGRDFSLAVQVFGDYGSWRCLPPKVEELLAWGKPDLVAYDRQGDRILFAVEETAAVPTGNQALQRCERMYGSARSRIPFWYLLSEYGVHLDGGTRRASIWPAVTAMKLAAHFRTPCVVLNYSSADAPEDYGAGTGTSALFEALTTILLNHACGRATLDGVQAQLTTQYTTMLAFVRSQAEHLTNFVPEPERLVDPATATALASVSVGLSEADSVRFMVWPTSEALPATFRAQQTPDPLIKPDPLLPRIEQLKSTGRCYTLSTNAGSRPQPPADLSDWISKQKSHFSRGAPLETPALFSMQLSDFPASAKGGRHVTTAKSIFFLIDRWDDLRACLEQAYPRLAGRLPDGDPAQPCLLYVSNSVKPGRIFGDPFTGQIAAYASIFGRFDHPQRRIVAYFPHQAHGQVNLEREIANKGRVIIAELVDLVVFHAGVVLDIGRNTWI